MSTAIVDPGSSPAAPPPLPADRRARALADRLLLPAALVAALVGSVVLWSLGRPTGTGAALTAVGQITGFACSVFALATIFLMARVPSVERWLGTDRSLVWHRWTATATAVTLVIHMVATVAGYAAADGTGLVHETSTLLGNYPDMLTATVGAALFLLVTISSVRVVRKRIPYESWLFGHWYVYPAVALSFFHELSDGSSFVKGTWPLLAWAWLHVVVGLTLVWYRGVLPAWRALNSDIRVARVRYEGPGAASVVLAGDGLNHFDAEAGMHLRIRFLTPGGWWQSHPYSLSARPTRDRWRITVVAAGDHSEESLSVPVGTKVVVTGAHGNLTAAARHTDHVALVAGGSGITPLRAVLEDLPPHVDVRLLYRAHEPAAVLLHAELDRLMAEHGSRVDYLVGPRHPDPALDVLAASRLAELVPDLARRDVYVCGTKGFVDTVCASLDELGAPAHLRHTERFDP